MVARRQVDLDQYVRKYPHMKRAEIHGLENLFCTWDADGSGEITLDEMNEMLQRVVRDLFDKIDLDGSGKLDSKEVRKLVTLLGQQLSDKEFREAMTAMDRDGSGQVSFSEFDAWWKGSDEGSADTNAEELSDLFAEVDSDGSGSIDVDEFISMIAVKMESRNSDGEKHEPREPMTLVRMAIQSVRDDVRAIYGMAQRPKTSLQAQQEVANLARKRRCFWTTENIGRPACVRFRRTWDAAQVFLLGYIAIAVPYRTGFNITIEPGSGWFWFEVLCDIYFAFDIFLNFRTAYRTDEGDLVIDPKTIRANYLSTWFAIDIAACFPLTYIELLVEHLASSDCALTAAQAAAGETCSDGGGFGAKLKAMKIARLLRLAKMLRLAKLRKVVKQIDEHYSGIWTVSKLFSLILIILYISHIFACMWYFAGSSNEIMSNGGTAYGWVHRLGYASRVDYGDPEHAQFATGPNKWPEDAWFSPYLDAYYYAITTLTTVGYGDRTPHTDMEKIFSIISELAGGITFGILAGTLSAMLTESNASDQKAEEQIEALKTFMSAKRVHKTLRRQITDQMEYFYKTKSVFDEADIVEKLPPKFKKTLLLTMYKPQLQTCPLFAGLDEAIITRIAIILRPYLGVEGDCVVREGDVGDEMYMVVKGDITLKSVAWPKFDGKSWGDGAFFGELPLLGMGGGPLRNKHVYDVTCTSDSDLTFLLGSQMTELERDYPVFKSQVRTLAAKRAERFGIILSRVTVTDARTQRRMSVALDSEALSNAAVLSDGARSSENSGQAPPEEDDSSEDEIPSAVGGDSHSTATLSHLIKRTCGETDERIDRVELKLSDVEEKLDKSLPGLEHKISSLESGMNSQLKDILDLIRQASTIDRSAPSHTQPSLQEGFAAGGTATSAPVGQAQQAEEDSEDLAIWLLKVGLDSSEVEHFREHGFDTTADVVTCGLSESDLKELGLTKIRQRKAVKAAIEEERIARGLSPSFAGELAGAEQLLPGNFGGSPGFGYRSSPSRPRTADGAYAGDGDLNLAEYKQLAVAAEQRMAGRRRLAANRAAEERSMSPDERRKARSMFGRGQLEKTQQLEQKHARQVAAARSISPFR